MFFDLKYLLFIAPALLLALWAQWRVRSSYLAGLNVPASMSGAAAARRILDAAGLQDVAIEQVPGQLSDHYDPREKVLRLSPEVYQGHTMASVGIAAHEAGHALQDAHRYAPLVVRNAAVPVANFGSGFSMLLFMVGLMVPALNFLLPVAIALFGAVVFFQLVNLPVEFNASSRAKEQLAMLGIVRAAEMDTVRGVLNAAAWTYVAATLQSVLTLLYLVSRARDSR